MRIENPEQFPQFYDSEKNINSETEKGENANLLFEPTPELVSAAYEALGLNKKVEPSEETIDYLYHRTVKDKAKGILTNGFKLKPDDAARIESGNGIYTVASLEDSNNPYNKKHYGNYIVKIGYDTSGIEWEHGKKVDFMKLTKEGKHGNRRYNIKDVGEVAVLHDLDKIVSLEISKDNGKTWERSTFFNHQTTPQQEQEVRQLYFQYLNSLSDKKSITKEGFIDFINNKSTATPKTEI